MTEKKDASKCPVPEETREHIKAARREMHQSVMGLFPPQFIEHRRAARREMLMAARSMINHALEHIEEH
ncbi:MAG: hypothetical protein ISR58_18900 [Anaerolineales bacterium]|nr:hypothetical protein [Chloroflexota bacterium]MBL6983251.1 hypothetical protein [Anaerolineales bacterium]